MIALDYEKAKIFLHKNKIENYEIKMIAGDASFRSYYRIFHGDNTHILMFAPPTHEDVVPFIVIAEFLIGNGFRAPQIIAINQDEGFLLLEDFGDDSFSKALSASSYSKQKELNLYKNACDCLTSLHKISPPKIALYNNELLWREVMLFADWYLPYVKNIKLSLPQIAHYKALWFKLFDNINRENQILVLRDFHADNLMVLKNQTGHKSVGLLDFQDAVVGSAAYDLVSLLEDARRDIDPENRQELLQYYIAQSNIDKEKFLQDYAIFSLQRNIKILGIFARLANRDSKPHYLKLLPRVNNFVKLRLKSDNIIFAQMADFLCDLL